MNSRKHYSALQTILLSGFVAGTLDILSAILILAKGNAAAVLRFIAKGALGPAATDGNVGIQLLGLCFHYIIAFSFAIGYFIVFPYLPILKRNKILSGLLYGIFVWAFMQFIVLPFTYNVPGPFAIEKAWKGIVILMLAVGLPVSFITARHYALRDR